MTNEAYQVVFITAGGQAEAELIATALVEERLAACVNLLGQCRSVYRWQGRINHDDEVLLVVKTRRALFSKLQQRVAELHSYDVPEIIALDIQNGSPAYLDFLNNSLQD